MEEIRFNLAAPDLLCICVDDRQHGESSGRVYCCYSREAMHFAHEYQLIKIIERLLDRIDYPQSSVKIRSFQEKEEKRLLKPEKVLRAERWRTTAENSIRFLYILSTGKTRPGRERYAG